MPEGKKSAALGPKYPSTPIKRATFGLSKSRYTTGLQCHKALYLKVHQPDLAGPIDAGTQRAFDQGHLVGEEARKRFPGGVLIECEHYETDTALKLTQEALLKDPAAVFEGAFFFQSTLVRVDVLKNNQDGTWDFFEVKSSTSVGEEHISDMAIQLYVLENSGVRVRNVYLKHVNRACVFPKLEDLFTDADCTEKVRAVLPAVPTHIKEMLIMLEKSKAPNTKIGTHCDSPYECDFKDQCWSEIPEHSVFELNNVTPEIKFGLFEQGIVRIHDIPVGMKVSRSKPQQIQAVKTNQPVIDKEGLRGFLNTFKYPLYFFDFETMNPAIPLFQGMSPYDQFPVQYSCHVLESEGAGLKHFEYLADGRTDCRAEIAKKMVDCLGSEGSIIAYNQSFEKSRIKELAEILPSLSNVLLNLLPRFVDLRDAFTKYYCHPDFHGSFSLKKVLPVLVPSMSYEGMEVGDGNTAQAAYLRLGDASLSAEERTALSKFMLEYCGQDTLAMVELLKALRFLSRI